MMFCEDNPFLLSIVKDQLRLVMEFFFSRQLFVFQLCEVKLEQCIDTGAIHLMLLVQEKKQKSLSLSGPCFLNAVSAILD